MAEGRTKLRIAIVGRVHTSAIEGLRDLPGSTRVSSFDDLYGDFDALRTFAPEVLVVDAEAVRETDLGVLRLLRQDERKPPLTLFAVPKERELLFSVLADRAEARTLGTPCETRDVAVALGVGDLGPDEPSGRGDGSARAASGPRPGPSTFFDIARGVADEINNPILFVDGHLQLLESSLDPTAEADRLAQCRAIRQGLDRIAATMDKVKRLGTVRELEPPFDHVPFAEVHGRVLAPRAVPDSLRVDIETESLGRSVRGSSEVWVEALGLFFDVLFDLSGVADTASLEIATIDADLCIRATLVGDRFVSWDGPRSFEPYYLNRVLRGSQHGLALFLVQTIVSAHGGRAIAARGRGGQVHLELHLKCA